MDNAVALVQAYLRLNGYFTVTEFPIVARGGPAGVRTVTDLDVLAFRFSGGGGPGPVHDAMPRAEPDPALGADPDAPDMIIGEVKEGRGRLNASALSPEVIETSLVRFGCCGAAVAPLLVQTLLAEGTTRLESGHLLRLVVFGALKDADAAPAHLVGLGHIVRFLQAFLDEHWSVLRHTESKDPAFGFLMTLEKALRDQPAGRSRPRADS
jgi:hypothetical protein